MQANDDAAAAAKAAVLVSRIMTGMALLAFALAALAALFGESLKPLGEVADGLAMWHLIAIGFALMGVSNAAMAAVMARQARATLAQISSGAKR